jgi:large subunit ribosomal protein L6
MSKIGRKPVALPTGVELKWQRPLLKIKGPKGELSTEVRPEVEITVKDGQVWVSRLQETKMAHALHGTYRSIIKNMIIGVTDGYEKKLEMVGVGYKAEVKGKGITLALGFSRPVDRPIPEGLQVVVEKNFISIKGINKQMVGQFAAELRILRPPEPYQGKGIRYVGEHVRHKAGKAAISAVGGAGAK